MAAKTGEETALITASMATETGVKKSPRARAAGRFAWQLQRLCHTGARVGLRAVPVSALDHRHPERIERPGG